MWIKAGPRYFNLDTIAYIQVALADDEKTVKTVYLHFVNESHTFTLHGDEATQLYAALDSMTHLPENRLAVMAN